MSDRTEIPNSKVISLRSDAPSGYVLVILCFMILAFSAVMAAMSTSVVSSSAVQTDRKDQDTARRYAMAARELVLRRSRSDDAAAGSGSWRARAQAGAYNFTDTLIGYGTMSTRLKDPSGNFTDRTWETAVLSCTGVAGNAVYSFMETVSPAPAEATTHTLFSATEIAVGAYTLVHGSAYANKKVSGKTLNGDAYAVEDITAKILGKRTLDVPVLQTPLADTTWYFTVGTVIPYQSEYKNKIFSPTSNPFGAPNPFGVYIISPASGDVRINSCRIVGTLVYPNAKDRKLVIKGGILMEAATPVQPVLIVLGNTKTKIEFDGKNELSEAAQAVNFNPPGLPYPYDELAMEILTPFQNYNPPGGSYPDIAAGVSDGDLSDKYVSHINGYIWCSGEIKARNSLLRLRGGLGCAKKLSVRGYVGWNSVSQFLPLIGMEGFGLVVFPGTFRQAT